MIDKRFLEICEVCGEPYIANPDKHLSCRAKKMGMIFTDENGEKWAEWEELTLIQRHPEYRTIRKVVEPMPELRVGDGVFISILGSAVVINGFSYMVEVATDRGVICKHRYEEVSEVYRDGKKIWERKA